MRNYQETIKQCKAEHGDKFNASGLSKQFIPYYESGERIKVKSCSEVLTGTIGKTTGWKPCFLLMRTSRSTGSSWTLSDKDQIIAVKQGRKYITN